MDGEGEGSASLQSRRSFSPGIEVGGRPPTGPHSPAYVSTARQSFDDDHTGVREPLPASQCSFSTFLALSGARSPTCQQQ